MLLLNLFGRNRAKWREVKWRNGARRVVMRIQFATDQPLAPPRLERLPPDEPGPVTGADEQMILAEVQSAVEAYNRMNRCDLRVRAIQYWANAAADHLDHGTAMRKLLNLL